MNWFGAFALTCLVELPIVAAVAPRPLRRRAALDSLAINLLTHPLAWYVSVTDLLAWTPTEVLVAIVEAAAYALVTRMSWPRAMAAAVLANGVTAAMSFLV
ncbi:MAG: hypothetical protein KDC98_03605 [Planctomycetes bacterium]|nr:hypothetical protein [Planctomycetota bacterium]